MGCSNSNTSSPKRDPLRTGKLKNNQENAIECKVVFLGDSGVGKSSISQRFCKNIFTEEHEVTIGGAYLQQKIQLKNGSFLKLHLWDTGGEERFRAMAPLYYRDANAAVLVYEVSDLKSFQSMQYWLNELNSRVKQDDLILALAGNKCDLPENTIQVSSSTARLYAENNKMIFSETSAKTGEGIQSLFQKLADEYLKKTENNK